MTEQKHGGGHVHPLYAVSIHHCIAGGDLQKMKALADEAQQHLNSHGNVSAALEALKIEIAKLESK
jgi:hypothetical protein